MNSAGEPMVKPGIRAFLCLICIATVVGSVFLMAETSRAQLEPKTSFNSALVQTGQDSDEAHLWQVAEQLRSFTFEAQRTLYEAERAEQDETRNTLVAQALTNIESAARVYTEDLHSSLSVLAPAADAWIQEALDDALQAAQTNDGPALSAARGRFWTGLLWGAQTAALASIESDDGARAADWLRLREFRRATKVSMIDDLARRTINSFRGGLTNQATTLAVVGDDLRDTYFFRLREALNNLEKAVKKGYPTRSAEWTGQLQGYFAILRDDFAAKEGASAATAVEQSLRNLEEDVLAGNLSQTAVFVSELRDLISSYQPVDLSPEEFARRSQLLYLFIDLVYIEYRDGVRNGQITIETEYLEALTFRDQAEVFLAELYPRISAADPAAAERLVVLLQEMKVALEQLDERKLVRSQVEEALALTEETLGDAVHDSSGEGIFNVVETLLNEMEQQVARGEYELAERSRIQAYALFDAGPELRLMAFSPDLVARLDGLFWHGFQGQPGLSLAVAQNRSPVEIAAIRDVLDEGLAEAQTVLGSGAAPLAIITNSAVIVFREGLEAIVILAALMASMVGAYAAFRRSMLVGVILATIATVITWWIAQRLMLAFSSFGERLEAVVSLIAVGVLLLITNWFFHRVYWKDWLAGFHQRKKVLLGGAAESLLSAQALGFIALGFTSVYREGFETVLFLQALVLDAGPAIVMQGVALGLLATAIVGFFTFQLQTRLPYKKMLVITGILIGGVLLIMVGNTIHTMQAVGWVPISPVGSLSLPYWVSLWLGIFPTWETICGQGAAAVFVIGSYYLAEFQQKQRVRAGAQEQAAALKEQTAQTK
ncbi:MAG: iron permease [Caldilineaceae bacterium SB0661_bin_32]|uniref:Iron permease n=1 Tax=Caldilineaceae bacterium SB0661_bin_32 TaxID=2605255 RepID=A0A6B1DCF5_9CHLR|nr:iron permease [Caldilineaceae bacterium SB0661_bin_32]